MSDSKTQYLHKGARVINAAISEVDLSDELKETAQRVVTLFATDLLPGLWLRKPEGAVPRPDAGDGPPRPATPADPTKRFPTNVELSQARAESARQALTEGGMAADKTTPRAIQTAGLSPATHRLKDGKKIDASKSWSASRHPAQRVARLASAPRTR